MSGHRAPPPTPRHGRVDAKAQKDSAGLSADWGHLCLRPHQSIQTCSVIIPLLPYFRQAHLYLTGAPPLCVPAFLVPGAPPGNPPPPTSSPGWASCRAGSPGPPMVSPALTSVLPYVRLAEAEPWCWLGLDSPLLSHLRAPPSVRVRVVLCRSELRCARPRTPCPRAGRALGAEEGLEPC